MTFPQFRKYSNNKSHFKIESYSAMEEIQTMGKYFSITRLNSDKMPDRNYISDLIKNPNGIFEVTNGKEYSLFLKNCVSNYTPLYKSIL